MIAVPVPTLLPEVTRESLAGIPLGPAPDTATPPIPEPIPEAMPGPTFDPTSVPAPGRAGRPSQRPRAELVPLGDDHLVDGATGTPGDRDNQWYLGAGGTMAHRPAVGQPKRPTRGGLRSDESACGIFLTQVPAGPDVPRCEQCESIDHALRHGGDAMA